MRKCQILLLMFVSLGLVLKMPSLQAQQKPQVAVLPFTSEGVSSATSDLLSEFLWQELYFSNAFKLTDLKKVKSTLSSAGVVDATCFDLACARQHGQALGVEKVIIGQVKKFDNRFRLQIKAMDVASQQEMYSETVAVTGEDELFTNLADFTGGITSALMQPAPAVVPKPKEEAVKPPSAPPEPKAPPLQIFHQPVSQAAAGQTIPIEAEVRPALRENKLFLLYRSLGQQDFHFTPMTRIVDKQFYGEIPATATSSQGLEYYLRVVDLSGNELGRFPVDDGFTSVIIERKVAETAIPSPEPQKQEKKGGKKWLWIGGGGVIAGLVAVIATSSGGGGSGNGAQLPGPPNYPGN